MVKKRVSRTRKRELEQPDEFITFSQQMLELATKHKFHLSIALGAVVVLSITVAGILYFENRAENTAFFLLGQGLNKYQATVQSSGSEQAYLDVAGDFDLIMQKYSGKVGGKLARIFWANMCFNAGKYDKAIALYNASLSDFGDNQFLKNIVLNSLAYAYEAVGDHAKAAAHFEMLASAADYSMKDEALFNLAQIYAASGNYEQSSSAFKQIVSDHDDSIYLEIAKERIPG